MEEKFYIRVSKGGGKAGMGYNKTGTIQVLERISDKCQLIKRQFSYQIDSNESYLKARQKAVKFLETLPTTKQ